MSGKALLVENGESRIALAAARALAAAGWTVGVAAPGRSMATVSRATRRLHLVPVPNDGVDAFVTALSAAVRDGRYDVVFGVGDAELLAISARRGELSAVVPYAAHEVVLTAIDKDELAQAAQSAGLRTPRGVDLSGLVNASGPLVVKPRLNGRVGHVGTSKIEAQVVEDGPAAARRADEVRAAGGEPVVQEAVRGDLMALVVLLAPDGQVVASVQQVAERLYPPGAGVSTRARTVPVDAELLAASTRMLQALGWWGVAELQFVAPPNGEPALIDLNGRFYGSMALAVAAGINLPDLWGRLALGETVAPVQARAGVRYQWLEGDLRRAVRQRDGGLLRDVAGCLLAAPRSHHSMWQRSDPLPFARVAGQLAARGPRKLARRLA